MHLQLLALLLGVLVPASQADLEGLWKYRSIARGGGTEVPIDGLFLFQGDRFVQQSLNAGEPFDQQFAQAHSGSVETGPGTLKILAEVGVVVDPTSDPPVEYRTASEHRVTAERSGDDLTLIFGTATVQKLERLGAGEGDLFSLDRGAFALVDGYFLLVAHTAERVIAGSGTFERRGDTLMLRAERWFTVEDGEPTYARDRVVEATLDDETLKLGDGPILHIRK